MSLRDKDAEFPKGITLKPEFRCGEARDPGGDLGARASGPLWTHANPRRHQHNNSTITSVGIPAAFRCPKRAGGPRAGPTANPVSAFGLNRYFFKLPRPGSWKNKTPFVCVLRR